MSLVKAFTQAAKDTINGFHFDDVWGVFNAAATGLNAYHFGSVAMAAGLSSSLVFSGGLVGLGLYFAHRNGQARREAGLKPRYIP
jgi:hypothetical protein